jgi:hypothetical protein
MVKLLDATETTRRVLQHVEILAGMLLLVLALPMATRAEGRIWGEALALMGLMALLSGLQWKIHWEVPYKGHTIRFENHPLSGEKLLIDGEQAARGGLGVRMVLQGHIREGEGAGDRIEAVSHAGLMNFRCKITAYPAGK